MNTIAWTIAAIPAGWLAAMLLITLIDVLKYGWHNNRSTPEIITMQQESIGHIIAVAAGGQSIDLAVVPTDTSSRPLLCRQGFHRLQWEKSIRNGEWWHSTKFHKPPEQGYWELTCQRERCRASLCFTTEPSRKLGKFRDQP